MTQHENILILPVPEDSWNYHFISMGVTGIGIKCFHSFDKGKVRVFSAPIAPGDWRIVGRAKELTEEQWRGVMPVFECYESYKKGFKNYSKFSHEYDLFATATESGMSLLRSYNIDPETNPLILKRDEV